MKKYEYALACCRDGKKSIMKDCRYKSEEDARQDILNFIGDTKRLLVVRREVGEWEEVK